MAAARKGYTDYPTLAHKAMESAGRTGAGIG